MADIQKSFTFLHENLPQWFSNVAEIEKKVVAMQSELSKIPVSRSLPFKRKTGSMESLRDLDAIQEESEAPAAGEPQSEPVTRKRKEPSLLSGRQSGPTKLRARTMVVVNYDGQMQTAFEQLVRAIGTGRNNLRKGKMAAKLEAMAALAGSSDEDEDDDANAIMSKIGYRHRSGLSSMRARGFMGAPQSSSSTPVERFDTADKELEEAQTLCERAAHQSLREGDCRKELDDVRRHFEVVAELAKGEVAKYTVQKLVTLDALDRAQQGPAGFGLPEKRTTVPLPAAEKKELASAVVPRAVSTHNDSKVVDIEIDDEEDTDDMNFVMPPIRLTSRG